MAPIKVFRSGKETFCEWRFEDGQSLGRILNQGAGTFLENEFSSPEEAKAFCDRELEKDASLIFYVMQGNDIIDAIQDDAFHSAEEKKQSRVFAAVSTVVVMLLASGVSVMFMPFQAMIYHLLFISGMGAFYLLLYSIGGGWNLESVVATIILLILISVAVPLLTK
jgi:hypothetical protein